MRQKGYPLAAHQRCEYCDDLLFARQFYLFPCTHGYHTDCLLQRIYSHRHLEPSQLAAVSKIEEEIRSLRSRSIENDKRSQVKLEYLQSELGKVTAFDVWICNLIASLNIYRRIHRCWLPSVWRRYDSLFSGIAARRRIRNWSGKLAIVIHPTNYCHG